MRLTNPETGRCYEPGLPVYENPEAGVSCFRADGCFIKVFFFTPKTKRAVLQHAHNEAESLQLVSRCTPHVPSLRDSWAEPDRFVLVMSEMPGASLRSWMQAHSKDREDASFLYERSRLILQIVHILQAIHKQRPALCHRDLKPENILVDESGSAPKISIIDFGCTKIPHIQAVGTVDYQAPEQRRSGQSAILSHKSDIFSLGLIFYELLTGTVPLIGRDLIPNGTQWKTALTLPKKLLTLPNGTLCNTLLQDMICFEPAQRPDYNRISRTISEFEEVSPCQKNWLSFLRRKNGKP